MTPYRSDPGVITSELIISKEKRAPGMWILNAELLKDKELQQNIKVEIIFIKNICLNPIQAR